jgi:hypothetical protein
MDKIINYLLLVIIFVFDPLAIALVIAANFAFAQLKTKKTYPIEEQVDDMRKVVEAYDDLEDEMKKWEEASLTDFKEDISSEFELIDEDKQYDLDGYGKLSEEELLFKRAEEDRLLNNQSVSGWRKNKILASRKNDEDEIKTY